MFGIARLLQVRCRRSEDRISPRDGARARFTWCRRFGGWAGSFLGAALVSGLLALGGLQDAVAQAIVIVANPPTTQTVNASSTATLQATVTCADCTVGTPIALTWTLSAGNGTLTPTTQNLTFATLGQAIIVQTQLTLTQDTGLRTVVATINGQSVTFSVTGINAPGVDQNAAQQEVQSALATYAALANIGVAGTALQLSNIDRRIRERRGGGPGLSIFGASLGVDGKTTAGNTLASRLKVAQNEPATPSRSDSAPADAGGHSPDPEPFGRLGVFVNGQGSFGNKDTTAQERGYDFTTGGLTAGVDYRFTDHLILGAAAGFLQTNSDYDASGGSTKTKGWSASLYGTYYPSEAFYIDGIATYGWNSYATERNSMLGGTVADGDTDGSQFGASLAVGYTMNRGALAFGPYVRASYIRVQVDAFTETGGGMSDVQVGAQTVNSVTTDLGVQASFAMSTSWAILSPNARFEWEHQYQDNSQLLTGSLVVDPLHTVFSVPTAEPDRNYFNLGIGLAAQFANGRAAFISYETVLGRDTVTNHVVTVGLRLEF